MYLTPWAASRRASASLYQPVEIGFDVPLFQVSGNEPVGAVMPSNDLVIFDGHPGSLAW